MRYKLIEKYTDENGVLVQKKLWKSKFKNKIRILIEDSFDIYAEHYDYHLIFNEKGFKERQKYESNHFENIEKSKDYKDFKYPQLFVIHKSNPVTIQSVIEFYNKYEDIDLKELQKNHGDEVLLSVIKARDIIKNIPIEFKDFV